MRRIEAERHGGPEVLSLVEHEDPKPGHGQLLVEVSAAGVNFRDIYERTGAYPGNPPLAMGAEGAGRVAAIGDGVDGFTVGERVAWANAPGSYATHVLVSAAAAVPVPAGVEDVLAAAVMLQGMTAHYLACSAFPIGSGHTAIVHAGAGGVGLLLTQIIKIRGGRVIATVSTDEKEELARGAGADLVVRYDGFADAAKDFTDGIGVDVVYDGVGKSTFDAGLTALRPRGLMALFGASSGPVPPIDPQTLNSSGSLFLTRPTLVDYVATRVELLYRAEELFDWIANDELSVRVGGRYSLAEAAQAQTELAARRSTGKLVLTV